ncbi:transketolase family protein [bacterium]
MSLKAMRDAFITAVCNRMIDDEKIFFLSADFGAPSLDKIRQEFPERFINVGIAEQNLINVSTGLALEGFTVYAYAISAFLTMRAYEQIRINLSLSSQVKEINVNLLGVGAGTSYDVAGPTHHCIEDISIMSLLPNITVFSPSDWVLAEKFVDITIKNKNPKYLRFDGKPVEQIYNNQDIDFDTGFCELKKGSKCCIVSTGYMTHTALKAVQILLDKNIEPGLVDIFLLKGFNKESLYKVLSQYEEVLTIEEAFIDRGGMDACIMNLLNEYRINIPVNKIGFKDKFVFCAGGRNHLHKISGFDEQSIAGEVERIIKSSRALKVIKL